MKVGFEPAPQLSLEMCSNFKASKIVSDQPEEKGVDDY